MFILYICICVFLNFRSMNLSILDADTYRNSRLQEHGFNQTKSASFYTFVSCVSLRVELNSAQLKKYLRRETFSPRSNKSWSNYLCWQAAKCSSAKGVWPEHEENIFPQNGIIASCKYNNAMPDTQWEVPQHLNSHPNSIRLKGFWFIKFPCIYGTI